MHRRIGIVVVAGALMLGGCIEDESVVRPDLTASQELMRRYVALGNSLTAGWMSGGINDSTQQLAYPVLLADFANVDFAVPSLTMPGCPPPLVGAIDSVEIAPDTFRIVLETDRVGGPSAPQCSLRDPAIPDVVQNLAVPGATMADAIDPDRPGQTPNTLQTLLLGGESQVIALLRAHPTFVTSWLGNNDVLGGALRGDPSLMTPLDTFQFYWDRVAVGIGSSGARGAAILSVVDMQYAPVIQPGLYFWVADSLGFAPKAVSDDCAPTDSLGVPNAFAMNEVSFLAYADTTLAEVSCDPSAPYVLTVPEMTQVAGRVGAFNSALSVEASERGWSYTNVNALLARVLGTTGNPSLLRQCRGLENDLTLDEIVAIVVAQCPHPSAPNFFGSLVTYDGIHMSPAAHVLLAEEVAAGINSVYGTSL